ncbi:MAG: TetR/AcrR family transcriptional regulator [Micromonosporaceae bacterium]
MAGTPGRSTRRRMPRADRERQMLEAAEAVFAERGYQDASMDEIARRVGVTKPMLYAYFGSKEGLLVASIGRVREDMTRAVVDALPGATTLRDVLWRGLLAYHEFVAGHDQGWAVVRQVASQAVSDQVEEIRRVLRDLIAEMILMYAPEAPALNREAYAELIVGACERAAIWRQTRDDVTPRQAAELVMEGLWNGIERLAERYGAALDNATSGISA